MSGSRLTTCIYLPLATAEEIDAEKQRLACKRSALLQRAWVIARAKIRAIPSPPRKEAPTTPCPHNVTIDTLPAFCARCGKEMG